MVQLHHCCTFVTALPAVSLVSASDMKPFQGLVSRSHPNSLSSDPVWWCWSRTVLSQETVSAPVGQRWCTSGFGRWCLSTGCIWLSLFINFITSCLAVGNCESFYLTFKLNTCSRAYWPFPTRKTQCSPELCPPMSKTQLCGSAPILVWSAPSVLQSADS